MIEHDLDDVITALSLALLDQKDIIHKLALIKIIQNPKAKNYEIAEYSGMRVDNVARFKCRKKTLIKQAQDILKELQNG
ncbi:hypothetical protein [Vibrio diazotrophicus]|uniref:hypothetical protein n=1 Tax=Vibrio diazotrophicus TaxID=685 RepID=UPI000C9E8E44|nr:hypothetical protein [Vibrio diazotrophicus]PNH81356.1 hypothetical protein C1N27_07370 [Vibrio diazotrophicus]